MELDPSGKHIALGGDLDGCDTLCKGISGIQDYPKLADRLLERGMTQETVLDLFWNNAIGVIKKCCM
jgi:membrane dipeptidase